MSVSLLFQPCLFSYHRFRQGSLSRIQNFTIISFNNKLQLPLKLAVGIKSCKDTVLFPCSPELSVDLQGFGQYFGPHVSHGVSTDVQFGQRGVAAQRIEDDGKVGLQLGISQGQ